VRDVCIAENVKEEEEEVCTKGMRTSNKHEEGQHGEFKMAMMTMTSGSISDRPIMSLLTVVLTSADYLADLK
jgi:hypothetical protein